MDNDSSTRSLRRIWYGLLAGILLMIGCSIEHDLHHEFTVPSRLALTRAPFADGRPTDFFAYTDSTLMRPVVELVRHIDDSLHFQAYFLERYGQPMWDYTLVHDNDSASYFYVPLVHDDDSLAIRTIWFFRLTPGWLLYAPIARDSSQAGQGEQSSMFDLLSYQVYGADNASGCLFAPQAMTRGWVLVEKCWDVFTGYGNPSDYTLNYQYTFCTEEFVWESDAQDWCINRDPDGTDGNGSGGNGGTGDGGGSSNPGKAGEIFTNSKFSQEDWDVVNLLLDTLREDCLGGRVIYVVDSLLGDDKLNIVFEKGSDGASFITYGKLKLGKEKVSANKLLHELIHFIQSKEDKQLFDSTFLNMELQAHYLQFLYLKRHLQEAIDDNVYDTLSGYSHRMRGMYALNQYINDKGEVIYPSTSPEYYDKQALHDCIEVFINNTLIPKFREEKIYGDYTYNDSLPLPILLKSIQNLTKDC